jgi:hypothetical protein
MSELTNRFYQHIPPYVQTNEYLVFDFNTTEELLDHPWIAVWGQQDFKEKPFSRYSLSKDGYLMAEFGDNEVWWALGKIQYPDKISLPAWGAPVETDRKNLIRNIKEQINSFAVKHSKYDIDALYVSIDILASFMIEEIEKKYQDVQQEEEFMKRTLAAIKCAVRFHDHE